MAGRKSGASEWITEDGLLLLTGWARDGITDKDIAEKKIHINESTFCRWKNDYPQIVQALKKGRAPVEEEVEDSLYQLCRVQTYTETIIEETQDADGNVLHRHVKKIKRESPPNVTAIIFALRNLKRHKWSNNPEAQRLQVELMDDGFLEALKGTAKDDWSEDDVQ